MFDAPAYLWLLLVAVPLALLHLRQRRQRLRVGSVMHWARSEPASPPEPAWRRLRLSRPLLLRLVVLVLLVLAAAQWRPGVPNRAVAVVIDSSASMRLRLPDGRSRLEAATQDAVTAIRSLADADTVSCCLSGEWPESLTFESSPTLAADMLGHSAAPGGGAPPAFALKSAAYWLGQTGRTDRQLVYAGDGFMARWPELPEGVQIREIFCPDALPNVAVLDVQPSRDLFRPQEIDVFFRVGQAGSPAVMRAVWNSSLDGVRAGSGQVSLEPGQIVPVRTRVRDFGRGGAVRVEINASDACQEDNVAERVVSPFRPIRVLLRCRAENRALRSAVAAIPEARVVTDVPGELSAESVDVCILESGSKPARVEGIPLLAFRAAESSGGDERKGGILDWWDLAHPILEGVDLPSLSVGEISPIQVAGGWQVLARGEQGAWIAARRADGQPVIEVAFDPLKTDFPTRPDFPVFVANCIRWLAAEPTAPTPVGDLVEAVDPVRPPPELRPDKPGFRLRPFPFDQPAWNLPLVVALLLVLLSIPGSARGRAR